VTRFRAVHGPGYAAAVCALWITTFVFGAWIYTEYRIYVRIPIEQAAFWKTQGSFEMKEHLATIGLGLLPIYGTSGSIPRTRTTTARGNGSRRISPARAGLFFWWARSSTT